MIATIIALGAIAIVEGVAICLIQARYTHEPITMDTLNKRVNEASRRAYDKGYDDGCDHGMIAGYDDGYNAGIHAEQKRYLREDEDCEVAD